MKKIISTFAFLSLVCIIAFSTEKSITYAETKNSYYKNEMGLSLTKNEYDKVVKHISPEELDLFTEDEMNYIMKNFEKNIIKESTIYVATSENSSDAETLQDIALSKEEMQKQLNVKDVAKANANFTDTLKTGMKAITMKLYASGLHVRKVTLTCDWLSIPQVKSYDVIGFRPTSTSYTIDINETDNVIGYQNHDGEKITYRHDSDNIKYTSSGLGLSTNISNSVKKSLSVSFASSFVTKDDITVYGTYQHAKKSISLSNSKKYTISSTGLGKVLKYKNGLDSYYDNTSGLKVNGSLLDFTK